MNGLSHISKKTRKDLSYSYQAICFLCGHWSSDINDRGHVGGQDSSFSAESKCIIDLSVGFPDSLCSLAGFLVCSGVLRQAAAWPGNQNEKRQLQTGCSATNSNYGATSSSHTVLRKPLPWNKVALFPSHLSVYKGICFSDKQQCWDIRYKVT